MLWTKLNHNLKVQSQFLQKYFSRAKTKILAWQVALEIVSELKAYYPNIYFVCYYSATLVRPFLANHSLLLSASKAASSRVSPSGSTDDRSRNPSSPTGWPVIHGRVFLVPLKSDLSCVATVKLCTLPSLLTRY